jgi:hypothetical protein
VLQVTHVAMLFPVVPRRSIGTQNLPALACSRHVDMKNSNILTLILQTKVKFLLLYTIFTKCIKWACNREVVYDLDYWGSKLKLVW